MTPIRIRREGLPSFYGWTKAKRFPSFVYSRDGNASLVHKVRSVDLCWVEYEWNYLLRHHSPVRAVAHTICGQQFHLEKAQTCALPRPDAVRCGRCHGNGPTFRRGGHQTKERREARAKLGCIAEAQ